MTIDANDIGAAITSANAPLVRSVDKLEQQIQRMSERLDQLPNVYMARAEYEPRHLELRTRIEALEIKFNDEHRWSLAEHSRILDQHNKDMEEVRGERQTSRGYTLNIWIALVGWFFGLLSLFISHFWH